MTSLSSFADQVGGHQGTMQEDETGSILIKQTSAREINFYQQLAPSMDADFIGSWTPKFYGVLQKQQQLNAETAAVAQEVGLDAPDVSKRVTSLTWRNAVYLTFSLSADRPWCARSHRR